MEIHGPEGPTHSFRDFAVHIVIVTIGILIALGLEGIRETIYVHRVVRDARENFRAELEANRSNLDRELKSDSKTLAKLDQIIADLPQLRKDPAKLRARVANVYPSGYFFSSSRWESALSTGALGHMSVDEVNRYAQVNFLVPVYTNLESQTNTDWQQLEAFFSAHENLTEQRQTQAWKNFTSTAPTPGVSNKSPRSFPTRSTKLFSRSNPLASDADFSIQGSSSMLSLGSRCASPPLLSRHSSPPEAFDRMTAPWTEKIQNRHPDQHEHDDQNGKDDTKSLFRHGTSYRLGSETIKRRGVPKEVRKFGNLYRARGA